MTVTTYNPGEQRVRRLADRMGYRLQKVRGEDSYLLSDASTGFLVLGHSVARGVWFGYTLAAIEDWLTE